MKVKIFQMNESSKFKFCGLRLMEKMGMPKEALSIDLYTCVYEGEVKCESLADLFICLNFNVPPNFRGHSLSVSDVVQVISGGELSPGYYFVDSMAFVMLPWSKPAVNS